MEATGVYWKPVFYALEDQFTLWLCNARNVKKVPGRKTDQLTELLHQTAQLSA
jgi:transposase